MLYDRSFNQSTQVLGKDAILPEANRPRKVLVRTDLNTRLGMGGRSNDVEQFEQVWNKGATEVMSTVKNSQPDNIVNPRIARTKKTEIDLSFSSKMFQIP